MRDFLVPIVCGNAGVLSRSLSSQVQLFVWLSLNGCGLFPLGFFPSPASLCDLIQHMIHTARSLGFHRKHGHVVQFTPSAHWQEAYVCLCVCLCTVLCFVCVETFIFCLLYVDMREVRASSFLFQWTYFITVLIHVFMYSWFSWLHFLLPLFGMCVINGVNPLSRLHKQAAESKCLPESLGVY